MRLLVGTPTRRVPLDRHKFEVGAPLFFLGVASGSFHWNVFFAAIALADERPVYRKSPRVP